MGGEADNDIARLRWEAALGSHHECLLREAADEIERLREALREIVKHSDYDDPVRDMALAALEDKQ